MSRNISLQEWEIHRRAFEGRAEDTLLAQQKLFRLMQALERGETSMAEKWLTVGVPLDLPLEFKEERGAVPGAERYRPETLPDLTCSTVLGLFCLRGEENQVEWLIKKGANPFQVFADNRDAAWMSMVGDNWNIHHYLLRLGAPVGLRLNDGMRTTRLMAATELANVRVVEQLLQKKADPNAYNRLGKTALHINFAKDPYSGDDFTIAKMLLAAGANPNQEDLSGIPPHMMANTEEARSALFGQELRVTVEMEVARLEAERLAALEEAAPDVDPADPGLPQISRVARIPKPKPPRL